MIWIAIIVCGALGVGLMAFAGWKLFATQADDHRLESPSEVEPSLEPSAQIPNDALSDYAQDLQSRLTAAAPALVSTAATSTANAVTDPETVPSVDENILNALTTPTHHMEEDYLQWLSEEDKAGRTITADEAFWAHEPETVRQWALENSYEPGPEWGVILSGTLTLDDIIALVEDPAFKDDWDEYFIGSAYIRVGDMKLQAGNSGNQNQIEEAGPKIEQALQSTSPHVREWAQLAGQYLSGAPISQEQHDLFNWRPENDG